MKEAALYAVAALGSLFLLGYSIHMLVGGLVSEQTEFWLITGACAIGAVVIGYMAYDVIRKRRGYR